MSLLLSASASLTYEVFASVPGIMRVTVAADARSGVSALLLQVLLASLLMVQTAKILHTNSLVALNLSALQLIEAHQTSIHSQRRSPRSQAKPKVC